MIRLPHRAGGEQGANLDEGERRSSGAVQAARISATSSVVGKDIVGPAIGEDLQSKGIWATLLSLGGILV